MPPARQLTIDDLHAEGGLDGPALRQPRVSPDGRLVTLLRGREDDASQLDLWAYDTATGDASMLVSSTDLVGDVDLSEEEKNRRERQRIYASGIVSYQWDAKGAQILFPLGGDIFLYQLADGRAVKVTDTGTFETDPKISPAGRYVSFIRNDELFVYDLATGTEQQLSSGATGTIRNGVSEFVAQEELDRDTGYWWSPDDRLIAYTQIDESPVDIVERLDFGPDGTRTISQRYPFAGTDNVTIRLGVVPAAGGETVWVDLGTEQDIYLADATWAADGGQLYVTLLSRDQKTLRVLAVAPETGASSTLMEETRETWINLRGGMRPLKDGSFLWESERDGFNHIYHHAADGSLIARVTRGDWVVSGIDCVDEASGALYFTGWTETPLERHVYRVSLSGGAPVQVSEGEGWHGASFAGSCDVWINTFSAPDQPSQARVRKADGEHLFWLKENRLDADHPYAPFIASHVAPEFGTIEADDGTPLHYQVMKPDLAPGQKVPAIIRVYGGPHAQTVQKDWTGAYDQMLVDKGYVVFRLDNRGAWNRGTAFENPLYRAMGSVEVADQAAGARWLAAQTYVDAGNIGVFGWSYGGYMTLHMLAQNPELYKAGVSGAPVTDWRTYDTAYTERYMGDPREVADAYDRSAVFAHLGGMKDDSLLLIHGMADDNVIFQNSVDLMAALHERDVAFEMMTYPGEKHGFRKRENKRHMDRLVVDFFERRLK
ncbi:peptidase S9 [Aquisalinus flavus]|uniref:Peptidase S9 n=2 Tax=Aquisalinus flavus TaxID=1526572 RepID=A0A8J2V7N2_9PROT|nr:peptidase S9 [Aquisalinus flavus]